MKMTKEKIVTEIIKLAGYKDGSDIKRLTMQKDK